MTHIKFFKKEALFVGFCVKGHTGKAEKGKDLLCEQISTISQFAVLALTEVEKIPCSYHISDGFLQLKLEKENDEKAQFLLKSCYQAFKSIEFEEKKFVKLEVENV